MPICIELRPDIYAPSKVKDDMVNKPINLEWDGLDYIIGLDEL
jgi:hypothetical protein